MVGKGSAGATHFRAPPHAAMRRHAVTRTNAVTRAAPPSHAATPACAVHHFPYFPAISPQAHLASLGFGPDRHISAQGDTNAGSRYEGKLVGDSPELMPLDNQLFAYLEHSIKQHAAITRGMAIGHPKRFGLSTPSEVASTIRRVWQAI